MARDFTINGESLVRVKFGGHIPSNFSNVAAPIDSTSNLSELGLASEGIRVTPQFVHADINVDDFGPNIPAEIMWMLADVQIRIPLIHYDATILDVCLSESMGGVMPGAANLGGTIFGYAGTLAPAGHLLGNMVQPLSSGNHFISLTIESPQLGFPWRFRTSYMTGPPMELPLGTDASIAVTNWRAIPYVVPPTSPGQGGNLYEIQSSGAVLWDHVDDT